MTVDRLLWSLDTLGADSWNTDTPWHRDTLREASALIKSLTADLAHQRAQIAQLEQMIDSAESQIAMELRKYEALHSALEQIEARWRETPKIFTGVNTVTELSEESDASIVRRQARVDCADELIHVLRHQEP